MYCCPDCGWSIALAAESGIVAAGANHRVAAELWDLLQFTSHVVRQSSVPVAAAAVAQEDVDTLRRAWLLSVAACKRPGRCTLTVGAAPTGVHQLLQAGAPDRVGPMSRAPQCSLPQCRSLCAAWGCDSNAPHAGRHGRVDHPGLSKPLQARRW